MLFGHHVIDRTVDEHVREVAAIARDPQTLIFLDTNILSYLYKLHDAARREFFAWTDAVAAANRLVVPAWAASEYLSRVTSKSLDTYTPKSKEVDQVKRLLGGLLDTASLFVDDASLRRVGFAGDRAAFLAGFRTAIGALSPFTGVFSQDFDPGTIHQQIATHLSPVILDSDLATLCVRASSEGPGRFEQRLPPGFRDEDKNENRFGDLIIWFEILAKAASSAAVLPKVLFISRDEKSDWVYAPKMRMEIVRGTRKPIGNARPEVKLADPRLVAEFRRATGHANLTITSISTLVEGLSKTNPGQFAHLAAAIQINTEEAAPAAGPAVEESEQPEGLAAAEVPVPEVPAEGHAQPAEPQPDRQEDNPAPGVAVDVPEAPGEPVPQPEPAEPAEPPPPRLRYDQVALHDRDYQADAPSAINEIIRALKSLNWYTQNPAIAKIRSIRQDEFPASSWFVLGRNIYQAACGNSQKAMEFMASLEGQLRQLPTETAQHVLAGMLFEVYFDSHGEFRRSAKFGYADKPLSVVASPDFSDALEFITYHLRNHRQQLKFMPGEVGRKTIRVVVGQVLQPDVEAPDALAGGPTAPANEVRSVLLDGVELMRDVVVDEDDAWQRMLGRTKLSPEAIRDEISDHLAIPKWALLIETEPQVRADLDLALPDGRELHPELALSVQ